MTWKRIKIGLLIILGLIIIIPTILYISAIDWSRKYQKEVAALPFYDGTKSSGEFRLAANELEFFIRMAGMDNDGEALVLLHGFPEASLMWQPLLDKAASEGYRVLAFDQRGYSPKARPKGVEHYHIDSLVKDVLAVADQVGFDTFHLVGHDWGSVVGWKTVMDFPERIHTWTGMSIPHTGVFFNSVLNDPIQKERSAYIHSLRKPYLPDFIFQAGQRSIINRKKGIWTDEEIDNYSAIQREYGAITSMLNWYRALDPEQTANNQTFQKHIIKPTAFIWGKEDPYVAPNIIPLQEKYIDAPYQSFPLDTEHSLMQTKTDSVLQIILEHISQY